MNTISEIESAIEKLPVSQVEEIAIWIDARLSKPPIDSAAEEWLQRARGAALPGTTTASVLVLSRGEE